VNASDLQEKISIGNRVYEGSSLWGYINGGADVYLEYGFIPIVQNNSNQIFIWELPPGKIIYLESDLTKKETEYYVNLVENFIKTVK